VLGVLVIAGEYSTGLIRTTFAAVGDRLALLGRRRWSSGDDDGSRHG
jgi:hypothetical protein